MNQRPWFSLNDQTDLGFDKTNYKGIFIQQFTKEDDDESVKEDDHKSAEFGGDHLCCHISALSSPCHTVCNLVNQNFVIIFIFGFHSLQLTLFSRIAITLLAFDMLPYLWKIIKFASVSVQIY